MKLCLNLSTLAHADLETQVSVCAQVGFQAVGLRLNKLEEYFAQGKNVENVRAILNAYHLLPLELNYFSDWIYKRDKAQKEVLDRFKSFSGLGKELGCPILILPTQCDGDHDDYLARENFHEICRVASEAGTQAALEFVPWSSINTIRKAWDLVRAVDHPASGLVLDSFHYFKGGSCLADLKDVPIERILLVHLADALNVDTDVATLCRNYRVPPGDGVFVFDELLAYLGATSYDGYYSLEVLNRDYQHLGPLEIAAHGKESLERILRA
ncbi:MAG TPA: sugar phosphate isomerase/epimerase [Candidatus Latescibacteria bacterium]|nr:sugar phosphate isomerase/epimerase [Candidatus Latescibacterota bacterium]